jgi:hypothetical protein
MPSGIKRSPIIITAGRAMYITNPRYEFELVNKELTTNKKTIMKKQINAMVAPIMESQFCVE